MAARLRVLQPGNPECAREREKKDTEKEREGTKEEKKERGREAGETGGRKKTRKEKVEEREEPSSLFISLPGRSTFYLPPRTYVYSSRIYLYPSTYVDVCVCIQGVPHALLDS